MLQLKNNTAISPSISLLPNEHGVDTLYIVLKASFDILPKLKLVKEQIPPFQEEVYWGEPGKSSIKYASDMHLGKASTDILLVGNAQAPGNASVTELDVSVQVANKRLDMKVFGDREWRSGQISTPQPFEKMPLTYENAYGGMYEYQAKNKQGELETQTLGEDANPVGKGFIGKRKKSETDGIALPNIEDPNDLISKLSHQPSPVCSAHSSPSWMPRKQYAGTYDEAWQRSRAPYLPEDFDKRFFNLAHESLIADGYLVGGEAIKLVNLSAQGELNFFLPANPLEVKVMMANREIKPELFMETVLIEPDDNRFSVTWRACVPCDKEALKIKQVDINYVQ